MKAPRAKARFQALLEEVEEDPDIQHVFSIEDSGSCSAATGPQQQQDGTESLGTENKELASQSTSTGVSVGCFSSLFLGCWKGKHVTPTDHSSNHSSNHNDHDARYRDQAQMGSYLQMVEPADMDLTFERFKSGTKICCSSSRQQTPEKAVVVACTTSQDENYNGISPKRRNGLETIRESREEDSNSLQRPSGSKGWEEEYRQQAAVMGDAIVEVGNFDQEQDNFTRSCRQSKLWTCSTKEHEELIQSHYKCSKKQRDHELETISGNYSFPPHRKDPSVVTFHNTHNKTAKSYSASNVLVDRWEKFDSVTTTSVMSSKEKEDTDYQLNGMTRYEMQQPDIRSNIPPKKDTMAGAKNNVTDKPEQPENSTLHTSSYLYISSEEQSNDSEDMMGVGDYDQEFRDEQELTQQELDDLDDMDEQKLLEQEAQLEKQIEQLMMQKDLQQKEQELAQWMHLVATQPFVVQARGSFVDIMNGTSNGNDRDASEDLVEDGLDHNAVNVDGDDLDAVFSGDDTLHHDNKRHSIEAPSNISKATENDNGPFDPFAASEEDEVNEEDYTPHPNSKETQHANGPFDPFAVGEEDEVYHQILTAYTQKTDNTQSSKTDTQTQAQTAAGMAKTTEDHSFFTPDPLADHTNADGPTTTGTHTEAVKPLSPLAEEKPTFVPDTSSNSKVKSIIQNLQAKASQSKTTAPQATTITVPNSDHKGTTRTEKESSLRHVSFLPLLQSQNSTCSTNQEYVSVASPSTGDFGGESSKTKDSTEEVTTAASAATPTTDNKEKKIPRHVRWKIPQEESTIVSSLTNSPPKPTTKAGPPARPLPNHTSSQHADKAVVMSPFLPKVTVEASARLLPMRMPKYTLFQPDDNVLSKDGGDAADTASPSSNSSSQSDTATPENSQDEEDTSAATSEEEEEEEEPHHLYSLLEDDKVLPPNDDPPHWENDGIVDWPSNESPEDIHKSIFEEINPVVAPPFRVEDDLNDKKKENNDGERQAEVSDGDSSVTSISGPISPPTPRRKFLMFHNSDAIFKRRQQSRLLQPDDEDDDEAAAAAAAEEEEAHGSPNIPRLDHASENNGTNVPVPVATTPASGIPVFPASTHNSSVLEKRKKFEQMMQQAKVLRAKSLLSPSSSFSSFCHSKPMSASSLQSDSFPRSVPATTDRQQEDMGVTFVACSNSTNGQDEGVLVLEEDDEGVFVLEEHDEEVFVLEEDEEKKEEAEPKDARRAPRDQQIPVATNTAPIHRIDNDLRQNYHLHKTRRFSSKVSSSSSDSIDDRGVERGIERALSSSFGRGSIASTNIADNTAEAAAERRAIQFWNEQITTSRYSGLLQQYATDSESSFFDSPARGRTKGRATSGDRSSSCSSTSSLVLSRIHALEQHMMKIRELEQSIDDDEEIGPC